jgi:hypothetical protein
MQNRYVGDVGDFAKYSLLKALCGTSGRAMRLAVIWYLYPDESHNSDGRHVGYLDLDDYRALDPILHAAMKRLVRGGIRGVAEVRRAAVLPAETTFFEEPIVRESGSDASGSERKAYRSEWLARATAAAAAADLVFLDPDNGIEVSSVPKCASRAGKYVFWDEIDAFWAGGKSLLIYHHLNRTKRAALQVEEMAARLRTNFSAADVTALVFRRGSCRVFWLIHPRGARGHEIERRAEKFLRSGWARHFQPFA